jgi:hypothetical protein
MNVISVQLKIGVMADTFQLATAMEMDSTIHQFTVAKLKISSSIYRNGSSLLATFRMKIRAE